MSLSAVGEADISKKEPRNSIELSPRLLERFATGAWADIHFCMMLAREILAEAPSPDGSMIARWYAIGTIYHA
jgi:hypothetical protein